MCSRTVEEPSDESKAFESILAQSSGSAGEVAGEPPSADQQYGGKRGKLLRMFFMFSLIVLSLLLAASVFRPMGTGKRYSEVQKAQLLRSAEEWIIQYDVINRKGSVTSYTIVVSVDGQPSTMTFSLPDGQSFPYIKRIRQDMLTGGIVKFAVHEEGHADPVEETVYYLAPK